MKGFRKLGVMIASLGMLLVGCNKSNPTPKPDPKPTYTATQVAEDFNTNIAQYGLEVTWDEEYQEYGLAVSFGESTDESEENLSSATLTLASFLPDYMVLGDTVYGDPTTEDYIDIFGDQSFYHYMDFTTPDESAMAAVISYVYSGLLIAQISIADLVD